MADAKQYTKIATGDIGTQLFWFNKNRVSDYSVDNVSLTITKFEEDKYLAEANNASLTFTYSTSGSTWKVESDSVTLADYGITLTGAPSNNDKITVTVGGKFEYAVPITAGAEFGGDTESFEASETDLDYVPKIGGRSTLNDISYTINYTSEKYQRVLDMSDNNDENIYMEVLSDGSAFVFAGTSGMPTVTAGDVRQITWTIVPSIVIFVDYIDTISANIVTRLTSVNANIVDGNEINMDISSIPQIRQDYYASKNMA